MLSKPNILIIDDHIDIANVIKIVLQKDGFNVNVFHDPFLALEHFKKDLKKIAVVISDVRMPYMSGLELMAKIKELKPEVNAIFITAFDVNYVKSDLDKYNYKVTEILQKPLLIKDLLKRIKKHLISI